jgi:hypothetical protein
LSSAASSSSLADPPHKPPTAVAPIPAPLFPAITSPRAENARLNASAQGWVASSERQWQYRIELRRWPVELDHPITADLPPGDLVYNEKSHRSTPGTGFPAVRAVLTIDDRQLTATVNEQTKAAIVQTELLAGSHRISAKFFDAEGRSLDVFYVYVSKMD